MSETTTYKCDTCGREEVGPPKTLVALRVEVLPLGEHVYAYGCPCVSRRHHICRACLSHSLIVLGFALLSPEEETTLGFADILFRELREDKPDPAATCEHTEEE